MDVLKISVPNGIAVGTFDNTITHNILHQRSSLDRRFSFTSGHTIKVQEFRRNTVPPRYLYFNQPIVPHAIISLVQYVLQPHLISLIQVEACRNHVCTSTFPKADSLLEWMGRSFWFLPPTLHVPVSLLYNSSRLSVSMSTYTLRCPPILFCSFLCQEWLRRGSCFVWNWVFFQELTVSVDAPVTF